MRLVSEVEGNRIHLDDGTVIRNNEIIKLPGLAISTYSQKKEIKRLHKNISKATFALLKFFKKIERG